MVRGCSPRRRSGCAADDDRGDDIELEPDGHRRIADRETGEFHDAAQAAEQPGQRVDQHLDPVGPDAARAGPWLRSSRRRRCGGRRRCTSAGPHGHAEQDDDRDARSQQEPRGAGLLAISSLTQVMGASIFWLPAIHLAAPRRCPSCPGDDERDEPEARHQRSVASPTSPPVRTPKQHGDQGRGAGIDGVGRDDAGRAMLEAAGRSIPPLMMIRVMPARPGRR